MANQTNDAYVRGMLYCDIRPGANRKEMLAWLSYVGLTTELHMWQNPHPFVEEGNLLQVVECIATPYATLAVEFAEQFGRNVYTPVAPYTPDLTGIPQTGLFEPKHDR